MTHLIAAIEARKAEVIDLARRAEQEYPEKLRIWQSEERAKIAIAEEGIALGKQPSSIYWSGPPPNGTKPNLSHYDRSLATLRMAVEESISITADDYAAYIK